MLGKTISQSNITLGLSLLGLAILAFAVFLPRSMSAQNQPADQIGPGCVVLLHGLGRMSSSMGELETKLERAGYVVANIGYPSRSEGVEALADEALAAGISSCAELTDNQQLNFVTHSLGGILVRSFAARNGTELINRVVMLGPPNQGAMIVDGLVDIPGFQLLTGPAGIQLGTGEGSILPSLGAVTFDLGVIAGDTNINPVASILVDGPNDSIVSVASTRVEGMAEHIVLPVTHTFMMRDNTVIDHVVHFLKNGRFIPDAP